MIAVMVKNIAVSLMENARKISLAVKKYVKTVIRRKTAQNAKKEAVTYIKNMHVATQSLISVKKMESVRKISHVAKTHVTIATENRAARMAVVI